jgi:hypothetical protein
LALSIQYGNVPTVAGSSDVLSTLRVTPALARMSRRVALAEPEVAIAATTIVGGGLHRASPGHVAANASVAPKTNKTAIAKRFNVVPFDILLRAV